MIKRGIALGIFFVMFIFLAPLIMADEIEQIQKAYSCLDTKTNNCAALDTEQKAFSLLSLGKCESQLKSSAKANPSNSAQECWATSSSGTFSACNMISTSKAALALESSNVDSSKAANWLLTQRKVPSGITWLLQIEANDAAVCNIASSKGTFNVNIAADKKLSGSGQCFSVYQGNYWLQINTNCYQEQFDISCDKGFLTNLLYKSSDDVGKLFVSGNTQRGIGGGDSVPLFINSFCMGVGSVCDYQATLWAATALDYMGYIEETDSLIPYLETESSKSANVQYLPEAFLYRLLGNTLGSNYRLSLLNRQKTVQQSPRNPDPAKGYWQASTSSDKFYDTALASLALDGSEIEFQKARNYLWSNGIQNSNGCWGAGTSEVIDTAFILYSIWPDDPRPAPECTTDPDCVALLGQGFRCSTNNTCVAIPPVPFCGDGAITASLNEICDGSNLGGKTCSNFNLNNGTLSCFSSSSSTPCRYDASGCFNTTIPPQCVKNNDCNLTQVCIFNKCVPDVDNAVCGNGLREGNEECDGNDWANFSECSDFPGRVSGNISCVGKGKNYECTFDLSKCVSDSSDCDNDSECGSGEICNNDGFCEAEVSSLDCEDDQGYFCRGSLDCTRDGGRVLSQYSCDSFDSCCSVQSSSSTCQELGGDICSSNQVCSGTPTSSSDLRSGETCCLSGICEDKTSDLSDCQNEGGVCRYSCQTDETVSYSTCSSTSDYCCIKSTPPPKKVNYLWLWISLVLVILVVIGIIFRDKLRILLMRIKSKFGGASKPKGPYSGFPPSTPPMMRAPMPRRILPPQGNRQRPMPPKPAPQKSKDLNDVLKKLKDMGS
ncbi:MAG: hypothetical protein AABW50_00685 [Nanoarchaeota archaeon]